MAAFSDLATVMQNARTDAGTLDTFIHGAADTKVVSRLGKQYWTLATLDNKLSLVKARTETTLADMDTLSASANDAITAKINNANLSIDAKVASIDTRADAEIANLQSAINTAVAAGAGENGWTSQIITTSYNRTQEQKNQDFISVKDFGAKGDGVTDDTQSFNNAVATGIPLYIPAGTYLLNGNINIPSRMSASITGAGKNKSVLLFNTGGISKEFGGTNTESFVISSLSIQSNSINPAAAIRCWRADATQASETDITIKDINISSNGGFHGSANCFKYGIRLEYVRFANISNVFAWGQEGYNAGVQNTQAVAAISILANDMVGQFGFNLNNNQITCWDTLVEANGWWEGIYVTGGEFWNSRLGFNLNRPVPSAQSPLAGTVKIANIHCNGAYRAINISNTNNISLTGCDLQNGIGGGTNNNKMVNFTNCYRAAIIGCTITNFYPNPCDGIFLQNCQNIVVANNSISNMVGSSLVAASSKNVNINNNTLTNIDFAGSYSVYATDDSDGFITNNSGVKGVVKGGILYNQPKFIYVETVQAQTGNTIINVPTAKTLNFVPEHVNVSTENMGNEVRAYYNKNQSTVDNLVIVLVANTTVDLRMSVEYPLC